MTGRRGTTFPEVFVAGFCLMLLLGLIAPLLGRTARVLQRCDQDATAQHESLIAVQRFFSEAAYSDARSLATYQPDPTICSFLTTRVRSGNPPALAFADYFPLASYSPQLHWQRFLVIYHQSSTRKLYFKEFAYVNDELARVDADRLCALAYRNDSPSFTISNDVIDFRVQSPRQGQAWLSVTTERKWDQTFRSTLNFMVTMRN